MPGCHHQAGPPSVWVKTLILRTLHGDAIHLLTSLHVMWQADAPSRMNRQGAARTYHTYLSWGYFQRRMAQQRETASAALGSSGSSSSNADTGIQASQACVCFQGPENAGKVGSDVLYC